MADFQITGSVRFDRSTYVEGQEEELLEAMDRLEEGTRRVSLQRLRPAGAVSGRPRARSSSSAAETPTEDDSGDEGGEEPDYADMLKSELEELAEEAGIEVEGTGKDGNVLKTDLVAALEAHQSDEG